MWKLLTNLIAVTGNLRKRGMQAITGCPVCRVEESKEHMAYQCGWTNAVWFGILGLRPNDQARPTLEEWIQDRRVEPCS